jgi:predicted RNA binding protein YcfA (HicA-like mRNA interferase family)
MMTKLPRPTGRELLAALKKLGFETIRTRGSHNYMRHDDGRATVVPIHSGETIGPGLMTKILRECEITIEDIKAVL